MFLWGEQLEQIHIKIFFQFKRNWGKNGSFFCDKFALKKMFPWWGQCWGEDLEQILKTNSI